MWGFIINGVQATLLERKKMPLVPWNGGISESKFKDDSSKGVLIG